MPWRVRVERHGKQFPAGQADAARWMKAGHATDADVAAGARGLMRGLQWRIKK